MKSALSWGILFLAVMLAAAPAQAANRTGSYLFDIAIDLKTPIPASQKIFCHVSHYRFMGSGTAFTSDATVQATRSGAKANCAARVYFSWPNTDYLPTQTVTISSYGPKDATSGVQPGKQQVIALNNSTTPAEGKSATITVTTEF